MLLSGHNKVKLEINEYVKINKRIYFHYIFIYTHTQYSNTFRNFILNNPQVKKCITMKIRKYFEWYQDENTNIFCSHQEQYFKGNS